MRKPTQASVTGERCRCGYLARSARHPLSPIRFDAQVNEYSFDQKLPSGGTFSLVIYHCPMCGGVASESKRDALFAAVPMDELVRLDELTDGLQTVQDIERVLGMADRDDTLRLPEELGLALGSAGNEDSKEFRTLTYSRISETAEVQFCIYTSGAVERTIFPKFIGVPSKKSKQAPKR